MNIGGLVANKFTDLEALLILLVIATVYLFKWLVFENKKANRRNYYRNVYLKSDAWRRKRYVVMKRDNWTCVYCGDKAKQVHHLKYAGNIGREPIDWLVSVCKDCHERKH